MGGISARLLSEEADADKLQRHMKGFPDVSLSCDVSLQNYYKTGLKVTKGS